MVSASADTLLEIRDLGVEFRTSKGVIHAIDGVNLSISKGDSVGIVGESGSGKSVTALAVLGLISAIGKVSNGRIVFNGKDLTHAPQDKMKTIRGKEIAMIFQEPMTALNPVFTVKQQLTDVIRLHTRCGESKAVERAMEVLTAVGLTDAKILNRYPHELSGGMAQRVMIAMALSCFPTLLIADEPTTALDVTTQSLILEELREMMKKFDLTLILITHDISIAAEICETLVVMYGGEVVEKGPLWEVLENPAHPYTQGLLNAIPSLDEKELKTIEGNLPSPYERQVGCRFNPRCPHVMGRCRTDKPPMIKLGEGHHASCFLYQGKGVDA